MWLQITIFAYFLNAVAISIDKFLLNKEIPRPSAYTFNIGVLNILIILVLAPFALSLISLKLIFISILAGLFFILALFLLYTALKNSDASQIVPFIGSLNPVFIFFLASIFLGEKLNHSELWAFFLILLGGALISYQKKESSLKEKIKKIFKKEKEISIKIVLVLAVFSAFSFALSYILTKYIYNSVNFLNGFVWTRLGLVLGALFLLIPPKSRQEIFQTEKKSNTKGNGLFLIGQIFGGLSFFLINYAFSLNSVTLVQGLQGLQYAFLFIIIIILSKKFPYILEEKLTPLIIVQKSVALFLIGWGLLLLMT